jgi:hypothetical protein
MCEKVVLAVLMALGPVATVYGLVKATLLKDILQSKDLL